MFPSVRETGFQSIPELSMTDGGRTMPLSTSNSTISHTHSTKWSPAELQPRTPSIHLWGLPATNNKCGIKQKRLTASEFAKSASWLKLHAHNFNLTYFCTLKFISSLITTKPVNTLITQKMSNNKQLVNTWMQHATCPALYHPSFSSVFFSLENLPYTNRNLYSKLALYCTTKHQRTTDIIQTEYTVFPLLEARPQIQAGCLIVARVV